LYANDQYLIIDPTNPNHIHIRAGGTQDESIADLILGGERNNVYIEDDARKVSISTRNALIENSYTNLSASTSTNFITSNASDINTDYIVTVGGSAYTVNSVTSNAPSAGSLTVTANGAVFAPGQQYTFTYDPPYNSYWEFTSNGYLLGPAMGGLFVSGILNGDNNLWLSSSHDVVISSGNGNGVFLENESIADNQVATIGDMAYTRVNVPTSSRGQAGDVAHLVADDTIHHYFCTGTYDGTTHIWKRIAWSNNTW
jgi:hypothetical protein